MSNEKKQITPATPMQHGRQQIAPAGISQPLAVAGNAGETAALAMAAKQKALVEARFTLAQHRPRDLDTVRERLKRECERPSFAASALYYKPVGDGIEGLSIRFVEAAIVAMQNVYSDITTIHDDPEKRIIHVEVTDAESNVAHSAEVTINKTVERSFVKDGDEVIRQRVNSRGKAVFIRRATDDEILNTVNALASKALRTCGLRLIPGWLADECEAWCRATKQKEDAADPDAAKRRLLDSFSSLGVTAEQVKAWLGRSEIGTLQPQERNVLGGIYNAMKDGETSWAEVMEQREAQRENGSAPAPATGGSLRDRVAQKTAPASQPASQATVDASTGQPTTAPAAGPLPGFSDVPAAGQSTTDPATAAMLARSRERAAQAERERQGGLPLREPGSDDGDE